MFFDLVYINRVPYWDSYTCAHELTSKKHPLTPFFVGGGDRYTYFQKLPWLVFLIIDHLWFYFWFVNLIFFK